MPRVALKKSHFETTTRSHFTDYRVNARASRIKPSVMSRSARVL
jgi:hypothetical protein